LRSWLEQDTSCPTCRKSLQDEKEQQNHQQAPNNTFNPNNQNDLQQQQQVQAQRFPNQQLPQQQGQPGFQRNVWQFNGSRYFRWLPSFSLQITNGGNLLPNLRAPLSPDQLNQMVYISIIIVN
jgi:autocrine motility factor receptor